MVTADEIQDPQVLDLSTRLNGRVMQHGNTKDMVFSVAELIAYCSTWTTLEPGDVIVTGTPGGVGFKRTPPVFMQVGDVVEIIVENIGTLTHRIEREL
jgi:2-keto-4-pentenoate hydratase/2-oxohepta-3-ene-1,7-dioic acid hydratase in catechol pathway